MQHTTSFRGIRIEDLLKSRVLFRGSEGEGEGSGTPPPSGGEGQAPPAGSSQTVEPKEKTPDTFDRAYVEGLRSESADWRTKYQSSQEELKKLADEKTAREKAEMTDLEKAQAERDEEKTAREKAESSLISERKRNAVIAEAAKLKFLDPEDALAHISLDDIQLTNDGQVHKTSVESAVKKVAESKKYLISGAGSADGGTTGTPPKPEAAKVAEWQNDMAARGGVKVGP